MPNDLASPTIGLQQPATPTDARAQHLLAELAQVLAEKEAECRALRDQVNQLTEANQLWQKEAERLREERDHHWKTVRRLLPPPPPDAVVFTAEEIEDLMKNGLSFADTIKELEQLMKGA
jgi:hypothetical protein